MEPTEGVAIENNGQSKTALAGYLSMSFLTVSPMSSPFKKWVRM